MVGVYSVPVRQTGTREQNTTNVNQPSKKRLGQVEWKPFEAVATTFTRRGNINR